MATKKTTKNTKKRGRPASKSNTKRTASSRKNTSKKTKQASPLAREIVFLALFVFAILSLLSLFQMCGVFGKGLSALLFGLLGALAYVFPVYLVVTAGLYLANAKNQRLRHKVWYSAGIYWSVCGLFQWVVNDPVQNVWEVYTVCAENHGGGGFFGGILSFELARVLGRAGSFIVILALFLLFFMLLSKKLIFSSIQQMYKERETDEDYYYEEPEPVYSRGRQMSTYTFDKEETSKAKPKKEPRKKRTKKAEADIPEDKNKLPQKEIKPEAQMEEVVPEVQDLSEINIIRGGEEPVRESSVYEKELEEKFGASKKTQSEPKTPTKTDTVDEPVKQKKEPVKKTKILKRPVSISDTKPLWTKHPNECTEEEYKEFYRKVFQDYKEPLFWIHLNMDYPFNLKGILYFPKVNLEYENAEGVIKLYNNQVFIADNIKEVIPEFLMLLKGVIDCPDLPLNVSRSALQNDGFVAKIADYITKKVADKLTGMCKTDRENFEKYWDDISPFIKYGCLKDEKFKSKMKDYILFKDLDDKYMTMKEYLETVDTPEAEVVEKGEEDKDSEPQEPPKTVIYYVK